MHFWAQVITKTTVNVVFVHSLIAIVRSLRTVSDQIGAKRNATRSAKQSNNDDDDNDDRNNDANNDDDDEDDDESAFDDDDDDLVDVDDDDAEDEATRRERVVVRVTQAHFVRAAQHTKSSLSDADAAKYKPL